MDPQIAAMLYLGVGGLAIAALVAAVVWWLDRQEHTLPPAE
jgi:hypothetical protein